MNTSTAITTEEACFLLYNDLHRLPTKEPLAVPPNIMQALCMTQPHTVVYRLLAETRDPVHGKGEQALTYELIRQIAHFGPKKFPLSWNG